MIPWLWAFYFLAKIALHLTGRINVHFWPNLFLFALAMPLSPKIAAPGRWTRPRRWSAAALGAALLWYDSYLPPFLYSVKFALNEKGMLTSGFLNEFVKGLFSAGAGSVLVFFALLALCLLGARKRLHPTAGVLLALLVVPLKALREPKDDVARAAVDFYQHEEGRRVTLPAALATRPFDLIIIHICSLSWDDLDAVSVEKPRLLKGANVLFTNFNSATSYSTPAALRLLRAPCGQIPHARLYAPWPEPCSLLAQLRRAGFRTYAAFNFDLRYFGMAQDLKRMAGLDDPVSISGLPQQMLSFDNQAVLRNGPLLERWWTLRESDGAPRAALFYNTISLHGGGHENKPEWWKDSNIPLYVRTLDDLGADVDALEKAIASSGRSAVFVIVPEHGAAMRGSLVQALDLRDIPLPAITRVPVAVRFVGPVFAGAASGLKDAAPSSYLAVAQLLADLMAKPALANDASALKREIAGLPRTPYLSETEKWKVFLYGGRYYVLGKDGDWKALPIEVEVAAGR